MFEFPNEKLTNLKNSKQFMCGHETVEKHVIVNTVSNTEKVSYLKFYCNRPKGHAGDHAIHTPKQRTIKSWTGE